MAFVSEKQYINEEDFIVLNASKALDIYDAILNISKINTIEF